MLARMSVLAAEHAAVPLLAPQGKMSCFFLRVLLSPSGNDQSRATGRSAARACEKLGVRVALLSFGGWWPSEGLAGPVARADVS